MKSRGLVVVIALLLLLILGAGAALVLDEGGTTVEPDTPDVSEPGTAAEAETQPDIEPVEAPTVVVRGPRLQGAGPHLLARATDSAEGEEEDEAVTARRELLGLVDWEAIGASARTLRRAAASAAANQLADRDPDDADVDAVNQERERLGILVEPLREPLGLHAYSAVLHHPLVHANVMAALLAAEGEALSVDQSKALDAQLAEQLARLAEERSEWDHSDRPMEARYREALHADEFRRWFHRGLSPRQRRAATPGDGHRITRLDPFSPAADFLGQAHELLFWGEKIDAEWIAMELETRLGLPGRREQFQAAAEKWLASVPEAYRRPAVRDWNHEQLLHPDRQVLMWAGAEVALQDEVERSVELDGARRHMLRQFPVIWRFTRLPREE